MKHRLFTKHVLVILGAILFALTSYGCIYLYHYVHIYKGVTSTVSDLGNVRAAFYKFHGTHRRCINGS